MAGLEFRGYSAGQGCQFGIVGLAARMGVERDPFIDGDDMKMEVEHGLSCRRLVELHQPQAIGPRSRFHGSGHPLHQRHHG
ncbi:hypothetical protein D3C87_1807610 [compost metagenome]